jgi:hypothetical protein
VGQSEKIEDQKEEDGEQEDRERVRTRMKSTLTCSFSSSSFFVKLMSSDAVISGDFGSNGSSRDDWIKRVCLLTHCEFDFRKSILKLLTIFDRVTHCVNKDL